MVNPAVNHFVFQSTAYMLVLNSNISFPLCFFHWVLISFCIHIKGGVSIVSAWSAFTLKTSSRKLPVSSWRTWHLWKCLRWKREAGTGKECIMRPLLLRPPLGCLDTAFSSFRAARNKLVTQAAVVPHLYYFRKTMHYQTEERGRPHSPDYRIYFSKLWSSPPWGRTNACPIHFVVF